VRAADRAYCVQSSVGNEMYSYSGPAGPLAPGPC
jgi:hypothetical protein